MKTTRIISTSATLIDHIYTNNITCGKSSIIITDVANHFGTFYISYDTEMYNKTSFSDKNIEKFKECLHVIDFADI